MGLQSGFEKDGGGTYSVWISRNIQKHAICCDYRIWRGVTVLYQTAVKKQCRNINDTVHDCIESGLFYAPSNCPKF